MPVDPYIGEISMSGFNFAPEGTLACNGATLASNSFPALYALLGAAFGGNGTTTFNVPDLRGRVPMGSGKGPGLTNKVIGNNGGEESTTLTLAQIPAHNHQMNAVTEAGNTSSPAGAYLANTGPLDKEYIASGTKTAMNAAVIQNAGSGAAHNNLPPYLVLNFYIAHEGTFPSRP